MNEHKGRGRCCKTIFLIKLRPQKKEVEAGMCLLWLEVKWREVKSFSHVRLFANPWIVAHQAPPSMGFSRQEYWSGLPFLYPGDLPDPGIEPRSPTLQADALTSEPPGKPKIRKFKMFRSNTDRLPWVVFWIVGHMRWALFVALITFPHSLIHECYYFVSKLVF